MPPSQRFEVDRMGLSEEKRKRKIFPKITLIDTLNFEALESSPGF